MLSLLSCERRDLAPGSGVEITFDLFPGSLLLRAAGFMKTGELEGTAGLAFLAVVVLGGSNVIEEDGSLSGSRVSRSWSSRAGLFKDGVDWPAGTLAGPLTSTVSANLTVLPEEARCGGDF